MVATPVTSPLSLLFLFSRNENYLFKRKAKAGKSFPSAGKGTVFDSQAPPPHREENQTGETFKSSKVSAAAKRPNRLTRRDRRYAFAASSQQSRGQTTGGTLYGSCGKGTVCAKSFPTAEPSESSGLPAPQSLFCDLVSKGRGFSPTGHTRGEPRALPEPRRYHPGL